MTLLANWSSGKATQLSTIKMQTFEGVPANIFNIIYITWSAFRAGY
ncbi:hypothetical protein ACVWYN_001024 [Pedobacter sp. UYP24]